MPVSNDPESSYGRRGFTVIHIYATQLKRMGLAMPPLPEQAAIARFLNETTASIDRGVARCRRQIELLREYRTRLIADAVTGKLDVREAAGQLPDEGADEELLEAGGATADYMNQNHYSAAETAAKPTMQGEATA